ncbi:uncharacterized protein LOC119112625 [Pollicipes pollicipes]|uniref:uncharacterized protein LOC119112427 n=1 Tax=Pollicipes pollicipes TaxID=41117 RepID=UPI001884AC27|nr:uncharacterized protein LOC119112427 [Pollicipes pollicipes]XP_037092744.1 uncharacterized protein LOC119112625 [Pollicipes pollicipes]
MNLGFDRTDDECTDDGPWKALRLDEEVGLIVGAAADAVEAEVALPPAHRPRPDTADEGVLDQSACSSASGGPQIVPAAAAARGARKRKRPRTNSCVRKKKRRSSKRR